MSDQDGVMRPADDRLRALGYLCDACLNQRPPSRIASRSDLPLKRVEAKTVDRELPLWASRAAA